MVVYETLPLAWGEQLSANPVGNTETSTLYPYK
ncbi:hypothetical protein PF005_g21291 [Phytophthora fragariae]|uniref:Uncharacterized protein n=1 Tax=Phytophthora fragariae TaxID=53985 RepID=A0A6A3WSE3_9STRA|nr:hypothetical protein PF009_g22270 [Phytophthora fragariae]KAE9084113.1 hypothetical protein PF007_g21641 [Phytophthora fragariae]KAE9110785.1 hypothetical protein PF006_g20363 [Phytophthora fragariae]KAE9185353.1 hypothetical protein PF005_g21291 [Phytophthora fragariae]KAE9293179.1 hypothetical protein PF001_g18379 [Phytophthora fragariae]